MHPHVGRPRRLRPLTRQFERSHLEPHLIVAAYECVCPLTRRPLTSRTMTPAAPPAAHSRAAAAVGG